MRIVPTALAVVLAVGAAHAQVPASAQQPSTQQPGAQQPTTQQPGIPPGAQQPGAPPPAGQVPGQQPPVPGAPPVTTPVVPTAAPLLSRSFTSKTGLLFVPVRPERALDFETVIGYLQKALESSTDPTVRSQAEGWRMFKAVEPGPNGVVVYVFLIDPAIPGAEYGLGRILADAYPEKIMEIWKLYTTSLAGGGSLQNLNAIVDGKVVLPPVVTPPGVTAPPAGVTPAPAAPPGTVPPVTTPPGAVPPSTTPPSAFPPTRP